MIIIYKKNTLIQISASSISNYTDSNYNCTFIILSYNCSKVEHILSYTCILKMYLNAH